MTRRERLRTEGLYALVVQRDYRQAAETFRTLATAFPFDDAALTNLAVSEFMLLDFSRAIETGKRAVQVSSSPTPKVNLALYAMYHAGDFDTATAEAQRVLTVNPQATMAYVPIAAKSILTGDMAAAQQLHDRMARAGARGAAVSQLAAADLLVFEGDLPRAIERVSSALSEEIVRNNVVVSARLLLLRAEVALLTSNRRAAETNARAALARDVSAATVFRAGEVLALTGAHDAATQQLDLLESHSEPAARWYKRILAARLAPGNEDLALNELEDALTKDPPMWIAHYSAA